MDERYDAGPELAEEEPHPTPTGVDPDRPGDPETVADDADVDPEAVIDETDVDPDIAT